MIRRLTYFCVPVAACLALSACSGSSDTPSAAAPSPVKVGAVTIPAGASGTDRAGQEQFARFWVDTVNKASDTGKTAPMKALAAPTCSVCADFAKHLESIYSSGGKVTTDGWKVTSVVPIANTPKNSPGVQLNLKVAPQVVVASKGAKPKTYKGGDVSWRFILVRKGDHWLVQRIDV